MPRAAAAGHVEDYNQGFCHGKRGENLLHSQLPNSAVPPNEAEDGRYKGRQ